MQESKPWYQSVTIIGAVVSAIVGILSIFHVNISDLSGDLTNGLLGLGLLVGTILTIVGRVRANKSISHGNSDSILPCLLVSFLLFGAVACADVQSRATNTTSAVTVTENGWTTFLQAVRKAAHVGLSDLQLVAKACWTITENLSADQFATYLAAFGVNASTIAEAKAAYIQAGACAHAAETIAATVDGATMATQAAQ